MREIDRRKLLKRVGTSVGTVGLAANVQAKGSQDELPNGYSDSAAVKNAISTHAAPLIRGLSEKGVISTSSADDFDISDPVRREEFREKTEATNVTRVGKGAEATVLIQIRRYFGADGEKILFNIKPEEGEASAIRYPNDRSDVDVFTLDSEDNVVVQGPCAIGDACRYLPGECAHYEVYCCPDSNSCGWGDDLGACAGFCYGSCDQVCF